MSQHRARYEKIRDAMRAEGLDVRESSQPFGHDRTLWDARSSARDATVEEAQRLLAVAMRCGANFWCGLNGNVGITTQLVEQSAPNGRGAA